MIMRPRPATSRDAASGVVEFAPVAARGIAEPDEPDAELPAGTPLEPDTGPAAAPPTVDVAAGSAPDADAVGFWAELSGVSTDEAGSAGAVTPAPSAPPGSPEAVVGAAGAVVVGDVDGPVVVVAGGDVVAGLVVDVGVVVDVDGGEVVVVGSTALSVLVKVQTTISPDSMLMVAEPPLVVVFSVPSSLHSTSVV